MSRLSDIAKGTRARKVVDLPFPGLDEPVKVAVRPLNGLELADVLSRAHAFAEEKGRKDAKPGDRLLDLGEMAATLSIAAEDPDKPGVPFFAGVDEVLELDAERITLLYEQQQAWQEHCAPRRNRMSGQEYWALLIKAAATEEGGDENPFEGLRRTLLESFALTTARQLFNALRLSSPSSSASEATPSISSSESKSESPQPPPNPA